MPRRTGLGSLTKEPPLSKLDATLLAITPDMPYGDLLQIGRQRTHKDAPGLLRQRFLLIDDSEKVVYDHFLSLVSSEGITSPRVRKIMYFVWAFRDERFRRFILERIADPTGKWRVGELTNKANIDFFTTWFKQSTATKIRSNIEFFFVETGILDRHAGVIHLELDDGWLPEAVQVSAQHEPNHAVRRGMSGGPLQFLVAKQWNGLVSATTSELLGIEGRSLAAHEPLEDVGINIVPARRSRARAWRARTLAARTRSTTAIVIDEVARERASASHQTLERLLAQAATVRGYAPKFNANIDMFFDTSEGTVLAEIKSCNQTNLHSQVRRGVSQLLEYRYVYCAEWTAPVSLLLAQLPHP